MHKPQKVLIRERKKKKMFDQIEKCTMKLQRSEFFKGLLPYCCAQGNDCTSVYILIKA